MFLALAQQPAPLTCAQKPVLCFEALWRHLPVRFCLCGGGLTGAPCVTWILWLAVKWWRGEQSVGVCVWADAKLKRWGRWLRNREEEAAGRAKNTKRIRQKFPARLCICAALLFSLVRFKHCGVKGQPQPWVACCLSSGLMLRFPLSLISLLLNLCLFHPSTH